MSEQKQAKPKSQTAAIILAVSTLIGTAGGTIALFFQQRSQRAEDDLVQKSERAVWEYRLSFLEKVVLARYGREARVVAAAPSSAPSTRMDGSGGDVGQLPQLPSVDSLREMARSGKTWSPISADK